MGAESRAFLEREFPEGASELPEGVTRRDMMMLLGASLSLMGLAGCRRPVEEIVPYVTAPEDVVPGVPRHYVRILPCEGGGSAEIGDPDTAGLWLTNQAPGLDAKVFARDVVDAGFLELVRYGIRAPGDPLVEDSLRVVDASLRVQTPFGPCWHRYTRDGYGEPEDGGPFRRHGIGRAWPILTGERAHYELAAGRNVEGYLRTLERLASGAGMLPEQVWDRADRPELGMRFGRPTGAAMPLVWTHAEYVKLLRSKADGVVFDLIPEVAARYASRR